jgi:hypothetical protein
MVLSIREALRRAKMNTANKKVEKDGADVFGIAKNVTEIGTTLVKAGAEIGLFPDKRRTGYSELIDRAFASLLDQVEAVRRALREIDDECSAGQKERVVAHLKRLGSSSEWERMERDMRMCAQLRLLHSQMHGFFGARSDKIVGVDRKKLLKVIDHMIHAGEARMADYITESLGSLAKKSALVKRGSVSLKQMRAELVAPIQALTEARTALIGLELEARNAILANSQIAGS